MDPLSQLLSLLKPRSYITAGFDAGGDWGLVLDDLAGRIKCYAVMRGGCWLAMAGLAPVHVRTGDCFILPSGRAATISSSLAAPPRPASEVLDPDRSGQVVTYNGGGEVFLVGSRFEIAGGHAAMMLQTLPPIIRVENAAEQARLRLYLELMMEEMRQGAPGSALVAQNLSHMILAQALRLYLADVPATDVGWFSALSDPRLGASLRAMQDDPARPWTLDALARIAGMSRSSFAQHFRSRVGETPMGFLSRWRMMSASALLIEGCSPIPQIALSLGYGSEQAFNAAFKRVMGSPPGLYARMHRNGQDLREPRPTG